MGRERIVRQRGLRGKIRALSHYDSHWMNTLYRTATRLATRARP